MKRRRLLLPALAVLLVADAAVGTPAAGPAQSIGAARLDSAWEELRVGRYWHASRILREAGADTAGEASVVLALAQAEAGWGHWPGVLGVLEGKPWLDAQELGAGRLLVARAQEDQERWGPAARSYEVWLSFPEGAGGHRSAVLARLARVTARAGDAPGALRALDRIPGPDGALRSWSALELAAQPSQAGDTALVRELVGRITDPGARDAGWRLLPLARLEAGDSSGAEARYLEIASGASGSRRGEASTEAGRLALARRDSAAARPLLEQGLSNGPLRSRGRAAAALLSFRDTDLTLTLAMAEVLDRLGDGGPALRAYDRAGRISRLDGRALPESARLARAILMATVRDRQDEALEEFRSLRATEDRRIGARNLEAWARMRLRQGRTGDVATLRSWLLEEYPESPEAAEVRWERGSAAEGRGDAADALREYRLLAESAGAQGRAGQARMRVGQILLAGRRLEEAAGVYEQYLADFPDGRRWEEATYWAARTRLQLSDTASARRHAGRLRREALVSYYAVMAADLVGEPYQVDVPPGEAPAEPAWLTAGLRTLDLLTEAGLHEGADAVEGSLVEQARGTRSVMLRLGEALNERGRTVTGINLGWEIRGEGGAWDRRLLQVVYPFPYRELVAREAREWGVDPILLAAIIRQESAFKADIRSGAGAVGLMQVMPPTGRELARAHGPAGFAEANLEAPEVNLHLGAAFFVEMSRRYDHDLPLVLSAYNAGPTRATRWRRYPEAADPERFTERIPFDETRTYVKNIRRNLGLYRILYGPA